MKEPQGALCKICLMFAAECAGKGSHQKLNLLVVKPLNKWKNAIADFDRHQKSQYHQHCTVLADNFMNVYSKNQTDIRSQLDIARAVNIAKNRKKLVPIIETIKLCGRQELALRGTSDFGNIKFNESEPEINDGNFRAILRMRHKCGDIDLKQHDENLQLNCTYYSPSIQYELISVCGEVIQKQLVTAINNAKSFSLLADETTDISRQEQMSICARYTELHNNVFVIREDFLTFVTVKSTTGASLAQTILESLNNMQIDCNYLVGQGYDGAACMNGNFNGVQAIIREKYPEAIYVHCSSHSLNLALGHSCQIQPIRNAIGIIKSIGNFFKSSAKRTNCLAKYIKNTMPETKWKTLTAMCETRWVENHDGLLRFKEIYKAIAGALEELIGDRDCDTSSKASSFVKSISNSQFAVSLCCLNSLFASTLPLCKMLQSTSCDLAAAVQHVELIINHFKNMRENSETEFADIYLDAENLLEFLGEKIAMPRITGRQQHRANVSEHDPKKYFRITIIIPLLEDFIHQLTLRFEKHNKTLTDLYKLIPTECVKPETKFEANTFSFYGRFLQENNNKSELSLWQTKWRKTCEKNLPNSAMEALGECNKEIFPNVHILLKILVTLPVTTCSSERSFSTMKRLKTYLRNSTSESRLNGLALMSVHRRINVPTEEVIDLFAAQKARRLNLIL